MKPIQNWKPVRWVVEIFEFLKPMNISVHAAYTSFFLVLSVFPTLLIFFAMLGYTSFGVEDVMALVEGVLPSAFLPLVERLLNSVYENTSGTILSVSVITAFWSASRGMLGLLEGLNSVYGVKERRNYFVTRGLCVGYTLLFLLVLVLTLVLNVFGNTILDYLHMTTNPVLLLIMDIIDLRFFLLLFLQTAVFTAMYAVLPNQRHSIVQSIPGALLAALGWLTFSDLFSVYVEHFPRYANIFGSIYAAALALLWLYCCICIVFYGGALNRYLARKKENVSET